MKILVLNTGSSSQKSCFYQLTDSLPDLPPEPIWEAKVGWSHHQGVAELKVKTSQSAVIRVVLVHTQEDWAIARACWKFTKA